MATLQSYSRNSRSSLQSDVTLPGGWYVLLRVCTKPGLQVHDITKHAARSKYQTLSSPQFLVDHLHMENVRLYMWDLLRE